MMRVICLLLVSLFALKVNAQQYTKFNGYGFAADRIKSDSISIHPSDTIRNKAARSIAVLNGVFYIADGTKWKVVGTDTTSLSNRINLKLNIADTINKWVTNVYKVNDSTIAVLKNGTTSNIVLNPAATKLVTSVYNKSGALIPKGSVVYIDGAHSSVLPSIALAKANKEESSAYTYGLVESDISNNAQGIVIQSGVITNLNLPTSSYTDGQTLYLSPTVAGGFTTTKPLAPNHYVAIGTIIRAHPNFGTIQIAIRNGFQLDEMSDVSIALVPLDSTILQFSRVDSLWHDVNPTTAMGNRFIKPTDTATMLTPYSRGSGTSGQVGYWNATRSLTGSSGFTFTPTSSLLLNNSVTAASAIARGQNITSTLTAAANSDVLVGLDVNPTFTNGSFTGVQNTSIRTFLINNTSMLGRNGLLINDDNLASNGGYNFLAWGVSNQPARTSGIRAFWLSNNGFEQGLAFHVASGGNGALTAVVSSEAMRITNTKNILIGTTTDAGYKLDVNGTARFVNGVNMATTSGSVGIGTASPISKLHIYESSAAATFLLETNSATDYSEISARNAGATSTSYFRQYSASASGTVLGNSVSNLSTFFSNFASNFAIGTLNGGNLILGTANTERMRIHSTSGNVLIGTTTDAGYKLDVNGTARVSGQLSLTTGNTYINSVSNNMWIAAVTSGTSDIQMIPGRQVNINNTGTYTAQASAILQMESTTKGFLPPRMTTTQKLAISSPAEGLQVYDLTLHQMSYFNGTIWINF